MKLVEFDLDAPLAKKPLRLAFRSESRSVTALFEKFFGSMQVARGWKVLVECVPEVTNADVRDLLGALTVQVLADMPAVMQLEGEAKQRAFMELLRTGLLHVVKAEGWADAQFHEAMTRLDDSRFVNEWWWREPKWNRSKTMKGKVFCTHTLAGMSAWLVVENKQGVELSRKPVVTDMPNEFEFVPLLGDVKWTTSSRFVLRSKAKEEVGSLETGSS
ncbi:MAG: hypothetical protein AAF735_06970 [Myxococcota bacterium]